MSGHDLALRTRSWLICRGHGRGASAAREAAIRLLNSSQATPEGRKASVQLHSHACQLLHVHAAPTDFALIRSGAMRLAQTERQSHNGGHVTWWHLASDLGDSDNLVFISPKPGSVRSEWQLMQHETVKVSRMKQNNLDIFGRQREKVFVAWHLRQC